MAEHKKTALLWILQALWQHSDEHNPMTQEELIDILWEKHGMKLDRRAVGRNLALLREAGVEVRSDGRGSWIGPESKPFSEDELRLLVKFIRECSFLTAKDSEDLIGRLCALSGKRFRDRDRYRAKTNRLANTFKKTKSRMFFLNMEKVDDAVWWGKRIRFIYPVVASNGEICPTQYVVLPRATELTGRECCMLTDDEPDIRFRIEDMSKIEEIR